MSAGAPGCFCWIELRSSDPQAARVFYTDLFGWVAQEGPAGPTGVYTRLKLGEREVGGLRALSAEEEAAKVPSHWLPFVAVSDVDEIASRVTGLGGRVVRDAFEVMDLGRMAVIADPAGAGFAVWQMGSHPGAVVANEPGAACWFELATRDAEGGARFYTELFGWTAKQERMGAAEYTLWMLGGTPVGGMMTMTHEFGETPAHWMVYLLVEDCDESAKRAESLGANLRVAPRDIPKTGRFAVLEDPTGAAISVFQGLSEA